MDVLIFLAEYFPKRDEAGTWVRSSSSRIHVRRLEFDFNVKVIIFRHIELGIGLT